MTVKEAETLLSEKERAYDEWWWLLSPGNSQMYAASVYADGSVYYHGFNVGLSYVRVRPVLQLLDCFTMGYNLGDEFKFGGKWFKVIFWDLAFCLEDIGHCRFRIDYEEDDANEYEKSDVKKFIDKWFEEAMKDHKQKERKLCL